MGTLSLDTEQKSGVKDKRRTYIQIPCTRGTLIFSVSIALIMSQVVLTDFYSLVLNGQIKTSPILQIMINYLNTTSQNKVGQVVTGSQILTNVGNGTFYIYSAIPEKWLPKLEWSSIVFNGWEHRDASAMTYRCCFQYNNGTKTSRKTTHKRWAFPKGELIAKQIVCDISNMTLPDLAGLVLLNESCKKDANYRQSVYRNRHETPKFAICAKIAYGNKNPKELVEWMEYHFHFGANAVVIYPYEDLNPSAMKVLKYYASKGQLEMVYLPRVPLSDTVKRRFDIASHVKDQDEQVPNFDVQERLLAYKYYTVMDTDEFIVPHKNITNFVQLMDSLLEKFPNAGTFQMLTEVHLLDWERTSNDTGLLIGQHGYHTDPRSLTVKYLHVTDRIKPGTVWIHGATPRSGFKKYVPDSSDVVLKHYRYCKNRWFLSLRDNKPCVEHFEKIRGHFMDDVAKIIGPKVAAIMENL